jgi:group II intron reverse transcriptase/maturase
MNDGSYEESDIGSPQGGVISPLLANIYLNYLDAIWEKHGSPLGKLVRYADDLVIICRTKKDAEHALKLLKATMTKLELELHPSKTRLVHMWDGKEGFDFLGLHHRRLLAKNSRGKPYSKIHQYPSKKATQKMKDAIKEVLASRSRLAMDMRNLVEQLNPKIRGWRNYYGMKTAGKCLNKIDWYILLRFTIWWNKKHQKKKHLSGIREVYKRIHDGGLLHLAG